MTTQSIPETMLYLRSRAAYEGGRFLNNAILGLPQADRDAIDAWLVSIKHPIAYEPGRQEYRLATVARQLAAEIAGAPDAL